MSELYLMVTITNRNRLPGFVSFYREHAEYPVPVMFVTLASGQQRDAGLFRAGGT